MGLKVENQSRRDKTVPVHCGSRRGEGWRRGGVNAGVDKLAEPEARALISAPRELPSRRATRLMRQCGATSRAVTFGQTPLIPVPHKPFHNKRYGSAVRMQR